MSNDIDFQGDGDLRDPALRRALDHAPDRDATPDPHTRDAILKMAHNLAATPVSAPATAANNASAAPWWRRLFGGGDTRARMPWNAAFATVLVAGFVTVLWHREPIPDARLDGEAKVASAPAPAAAPTPPAADSAPSPAIVAQQAPAAEAPAAPARDAVREAPDRATADAARKPAPATARKQVEAIPAPAPEAKETPAEPISTPAPAEAQSAAVPAPPPPATVAPAPPPAPGAAPPPALAAQAPGIADSSARVCQKSESAQDEREQERRSAYAAAPSAPSVAPAPIAVPERSPPSVVAAAPPAPVAPAPLQRELPANASGSVARGGSPNADVSGALRDTAPPRAAAAKAARSPTGASSFSALDRWTSFDFVRAGLGVRHVRGDIEGLAALVNTVARSATVADAQLAAPVEARLSLYQGGTLIAVLEIAGDQVRWTPQPGGTATVGTPPAQTLAALRALLTR